MTRAPCGGCAKARAYMPAAIRARLEVVEARMRAKRQAIAIKYSVGPQPSNEGAKIDTAPAKP